MSYYEPDGRGRQIEWAEAPGQVAYEGAMGTVDGEQEL
jgi:hypothetical protein